MPRRTILYLGPATPLAVRILAALAREGLLCRRDGYREGRGRARGALAVVVDLGRGAPEALEACRAIKADPRARGTPVLALALTSAPEVQLAGFDAQADNCLVLPDDLRVLTAHVLALVRRFALAPASKVLRAGSISVDARAGRAAVGGRPLKLTPAEFCILELLVRRRGGIVRRDEIQERTRRAFSASLTHAVETHVCNLRRKLGPQAGRRVQSIPGVGYLPRAENAILSR